MERGVPVDIDLKQLEQMDRQSLLEYIEALEAKTASLEEKMEDLKAQVDVLNMDMDDFKVGRCTGTEGVSADV